MIYRLSGSGTFRGATLKSRELTKQEKAQAQNFHGDNATAIRAHQSGFYVQGLRVRSAKSWSKIENIPKSAFKSVF